MITLNVHKVTDITIKAPWYSFDPNPPVYWRTIEITDKDGNKFEINLFADEAEALDITLDPQPTPDQ